MTSAPAGPLAAASQRLRGKPGRPRRAGSWQSQDTSHAGYRTKDGYETRAPAQPVITPRLLDLEATAAYLGVSPWTVRDLDAAGVLRRVCIPLPGGRELRKLLFDKADLDRVIESWKEPGR